MEISQSVSNLPDSISVGFAIALIIITVLSSIMSSIIPITYFIFKRCQGHPTKLIAIICLTDLILGYNLVLICLNIYSIESGFHLEEIFSILTLHFRFHPTDVGFCTLNLSLFIFLETLSLCFNLCLAFDLILTITKPFLSGKSRQLFYYLGSGLMSIGIFVTMVKYPLVVMMLIFELLAAMTVVWAIIELYSKKKTTKAKSSYIKQHVAVLVTLMICYFFPCLNNFLQIFNKSDKIANKYIRNTSFVCLLVSGSFVNIVRLMDPYVRKNVLYVWSRIKKCKFSSAPNTYLKQDKKQDKNHIDDWNGSLNDLVIQFQNESILQNILFVVEQVSHMKEEGLIGGSVLQMHEDQVNNLLFGNQKQQLQKAVKLKKTLKTYCVEYKTNLKDFRATAIMLQTSYKFESHSPQQNKHFKIKATALSYYIFQKIRMMDGLNNQELSKSLDLQMNIQSIKQSKQSMGASGSFFFFSYDKRLIIKTITSQEQECLLSFLPQYYLYLCQNPYTLLSKIYGIYNIEIGKSSKIIFLLMENSFRGFSRKKLNYQIYDMKGSMVNRQVKKPNAAVLKDVNFLKSKQPFIFMTPTEKDQFIEQVTRDITMLASQNIMDYSLLLGISNIDDNYVYRRGNFKNWKWMDSTHLIDQRIYCISIIDYLQKFNCQKQMQLRFKTFFSPNLDVSCVNPQKYLQRYINFLKTIIVTVQQ